MLTDLSSEIITFLTKTNAELRLCERDERCRDCMLIRRRWR